jgi:hypothetical protein
MFGFRKPTPAPEGPVQIKVAVEVEKPAAEVYALVDWADARNAKRELGHRVEPIEGRPGDYCLTLTEMPEHRFDMTVIESVQDRAYAFSTDIVPRVGRLEASEEHYSFEPSGDDRCKVTLTMVATFRAGLDMDEFEEEVMMVGLACQRGILKLKVHAEEGAEAVKAFDLEF